MSKIGRFAPAIFVLLAMVVLLAGCADQTTQESPTPTPTPTATPIVSLPAIQPTATSSASDLPGISEVATLVEAAPSRTPEPTATPDALTVAADEVAQQTGLAGKSLLGLSIEDWFSLAASLLIVLAAYLAGSWAVHWLFPRLVARTETDLDDRLLKASGNSIRWLIVVLLLSFATVRLDFIGARLQTFLSDFYFLLTLGLSFQISWRLIDLIAKLLDEQTKKADNQQEAESLVTLVVWALRMIMLIIAFSFFLNHFGINVTGLAVFLVITGLAISLAGRDVLADVIAGALILLDQPYRIGDRVAITNLDTWGDVTEIGTRYTKIVTFDNRTVVMPNSQIGQNQIVNYSLPDPSFYVQVNLGIAYENDLDEVEKLVKDTIHSLDGVMKDRAVDVLVTGFEETQIIMLLGWWIETYENLYALRDQTSRAVVKALKDAGVVLPYRRYRSDPGMLAVGAAPGQKDDDQT